MKQPIDLKMFRNPAWAAGSCSSGPPATATVRTKSTGSFYQHDRSPCREEARTKYGSAAPIVDGGLADAEPPQQRQEVQSRLAGAAVGILRRVTGSQFNRLFGFKSYGG